MMKTKRLLSIGAALLIMMGCASFQPPEGFQPGESEPLLEGTRWKDNWGNTYQFKAGGDLIVPWTSNHSIWSRTGDAVTLFWDRDSDGLYRGRYLLTYNAATQMMQGTAETSAGGSMQMILKRVGSSAQSGEAPPQTPVEKPVEQEIGVEGALAKGAQETLKNVQQKSNIAIVYITAPDKSTTDFITGELEYIWVNAGYTIIDRSQLDRLRREQDFQLSGEVDDETAVSIGKIAGADIIVTGRIDGEGNLRRLRLRAIDTQTAQVVGVSSERY
ncbi:MAG: CsgG/HfaB family protein [Spirochaetaceae bacterium]|jgi:hypothetical protein|nr:CsgG/HfaB family protein [Spirochaetaceae bacterium]